MKKSSKPLCIELLRVVLDSVLNYLPILLLSVALPLSAAPSIERVWPNFREAADFDRIGEYFGGQEQAPGRCILRSQAAQRAGWYVTVRISDAASVPEGCRWMLQVILPGSSQPRTQAFPIPAGTRSAVFELGLTGTDAPTPRSRPLAWRLALVDSQGRELLSKESAAWR